MIDASISIARKAGAPITGLRLIALRKSESATQISRDKARRAARKGGHKLQTGTLVAAEWILLVTSLDAKSFSAEQVGALYRMRWRVNRRSNVTPHRRSILTPPSHELMGDLPHA